MKRFASALCAIGLAGIVTGSTFAGNLPSSKAAAAVGEVYALSGAAANADPNTVSDGYDTGWVTISRSYIKTPNYKDLTFDVAMQCGIVTFTEVKSKGGNRDTSQASGTVRVRVKITNEDGTIVRYAEPLEEGQEDLGVTFCHRMQTLSAVFQGLIDQCISAEGTIDLSGDCLEPEEVSLLLETLSANSFNFLLMDVMPGIQTIEVQARAQATVDLFDSQSGSARGEAFVGVGSMRFETIRLIKNADTDVVELD